MKTLKPLLLLVIIACFTGCKKDEPSVVTFQVSLSNKGYTDSDVYLYETRGLDGMGLYDIMEPQKAESYVSVIGKDGVSHKEMYRATCDNSGTAIIYGVMPGKYIALIRGDGYFTSGWLAKYVTPIAYGIVEITSGEPKRIVQNFSYGSDDFDVITSN